METIITQQCWIWYNGVFVKSKIGVQESSGAMHLYSSDMDLYVQVHIAMAVKKTTCFIRQVTVQEGGIYI